MAIDNPVDAVKSQYPEASENPFKLVLLGFKMGIPQAAPLFELMSHVYERFSGKAVQERMEAFWKALIDEQKFLDADIKKLRVDLEDLKEAIQLATLRDVEAFNDNKRERYLKILGSAVRSEDEIQDLAGFIHDVEVLGERDVIVLRVLNNVMNKPEDWKEPGGRVRHKLHPNTFIHRRQELAVQIAQALGMPSTGGNDVPSFSGEEGYAICARLQGFGLAHQVQLSPFEVPVGNDSCFRPSKRGLMLLKLIGEDVPNWEHYFPPAKSSA